MSTPGDFPTSLQLWLQADAITGLSDGAAVASWVDSSGNSNTATQATSGARPTYKTGITNGLPVVRFDGGDYLASAAPSWAAAQTVVAVVKSTNLAAVNTIRGAASVGGLQFRVEQTANSYLRFVKQAAADIGQGNVAVTASAWHVVTGTWNDSTNAYAFTVDGAAGGGGSSSVNLTFDSTVIGRNNQTGSEYFIGDIAEIAAWDRVLNSTDLAAVIAGLQSKWFAPTSFTYTPPEATATSSAPAPKINLFLGAPKAAATALALTAALTLGNAPLPFTPPEATATASSPAPSIVLGPFGFTPPQATSTGAAPAPAIGFGAFEVTPPKATASSTAPTPSINVEGSPLELATPPAAATSAALAPALAIPVVGVPWTADLSRRTLMPFVTSGRATSSPPIPAVPPGIVERTILRRSRVVPDLRSIEGVIVDPTTNQLRLPDDVYFALPTVDEEVGVPHIIFRNHSGAVDVTYWRGLFSQLLTSKREEPFGDSTMSFELPSVSSMDEWPDEPDMPLAFMINRANVQIELVKSDGSRRVVWTGHIVSHATGNNESTPTKTIQCVGTMFQAATDRMKPAPFLDPTDIGTLISKALNGVANRRYPVMTAPATGIMSRQRGSWADSPLAYVQGLLATAWTEDGRQWTVAKVKDSTRTYEVRLKKTTPEWTVTNGAHGVSVDLTRDEASIRNVIYGHGVGPDGNAWFNYHYPNLNLVDAPAFPYSDPDAVMTVGTTDADTTSGHGVTVWQQRARDLGYKVPLDAVFNTSDAAVARTIQRRYGITVDGVVGGQTWTAMFVTGANSGDLSQVVRIPLASDPRTQRWLYNADGSIAGANPLWNTNVLTYADDVDFGTGITRLEGIASAQQIIDREAEAGLTGRIVLTQDPREGWRGDITPGDKLTLVGYEGADRVLHVTSAEIDWRSGAVTLDVDEKSRDALTIAQIRARDKEARRDPARRKGNPNKRSRLDVDQVVPFDGESGAGVIPRHPINGGLWNVYRIPVSETGRVAKMRVTCTAPFAIVLLGAPTTAAHMASWVGNPFASDSPLQAHERELDSHWLIEGFGQKGQRCGYYPGAEDADDPFTGVEEMSGFEYTSSRPPWIWVAEYASSSCFLEGYIYPDTVV